MKLAEITTDISRIGGLPLDEEILLSICIPTYSRQKVLKQCLESILVQNPPKEVEILVCDNASQDGTQQVVAGYVERCPNIRYIRNESNMGADANYLICARNARGIFLQLLGDDDFLDKSAVQYILAFLKENRDLSTIVLNWDHFKLVDGENKYYWNWYKIGEPIVFNDKNQFLSYIAMEGVTFLSNKILRVSALKPVEDLEQFIGSRFIQSYMMLHCLEKNQRSAVIKKVMVHQGDVNREVAEMTLDFAISIFHELQYPILHYAEKVLSYQSNVISDLFYRSIRSEWKQLLLIRGAYSIKPSLEIGKKFNEHFTAYRTTYVLGVISSILPLTIVKAIIRVYRILTYGPGVPTRER